MDAMSVLPVNAGGEGSAAGAGALGAFAGALFGSWFGDGWGRGGYGGAPAGATAAGQVSAAIDNGVVLDSLSAIQNQIANVGANVVNGVNDVSRSVMASANATQMGLCDLGYRGAQETAQVVSALNTGFGGLNATVQNSGFESRMATQQLASQMAACCCDTQKTIMAEGAATRGLIDRYAYESLQNQLCDAKAKIGSLEAQNYLAASQSAQTQQIINTVLAHLK